MIVSGLLDFEIIYIADELVQQKIKFLQLGSLQAVKADFLSKK